MKKLYCDMHLFDLHQNMYLLDMNEETADRVAIFSAENFGENLEIMLNKYPEVEAVAVNQAYAEYAQSIIDNLDNTKFANKNIKVEVI